MTLDNISMREIKFRLPIELNGVKSLLCYSLNEVVTGGGIDLSLFDWYGDFQLFTGLLDKNGREIYEGDIIKETTSKGLDLPERFKNHVLKEHEKHKIQKIQWGKYADGEYSDSVECWMFGEDNSLSELISRTKGSYHEWVREYEVIGNIFENPELLQQK